MHTEGAGVPRREAPACKVVEPGRSFLWRIFELLAGTKKAHHHICLGEVARSDIIWWDTFLKSWNGVSIFPPSLSQHPRHHFYSDAAGSFGCGAVWENHWFPYQWPPSSRGSAIATQELLPIFVACMIWGPWWKDSSVLVHCDNLAVVQVVNSGYSTDKDMMHILCCLFFIRAYWGIRLQAEHIQGELNVGHAPTRVRH